MEIRYISDTEIEPLIELLGETFSQAEESFATFEQSFLVAYDAIFTQLSRVVAVKESGRSVKASLSMSKWVEPSRVIGVVVSDQSALQPQLITSINTALTQIRDRFAVVLDNYPTLVYIFPEGKVFILNGSAENDISVLGLR